MEKILVVVVVAMLAGCAGGRQEMTEAQKQQFIQEQQREHQRKAIAYEKSESGQKMTLEQIEIATGTTAEDNAERQAQRNVAAAQYLEAMHPYRLNGLTMATTIANWH